MTQEQPGGSWLQDRLAKLQAIYSKLGRAGLSEHPLADVNLLLQHKQLQFRDMPRRDLSEGEKKAAREMELEIRDLTAYVRSQVALVTPTSLHELRQYGERTQAQSTQQQGYQKDDKGRGR